MSEINEFAEKQATLKNTGFKDLIPNKSTVIVGLAVSLKTGGGLDFATGELASTLSEWETRMKADKSSRVFVLPFADAINDKSTEDTYRDTLLGSKFNSKGLKGYEFMIDANAYLAANLMSLNGKSLKCTTIDAANQLEGTTPDGTKFQGYDCTLRVGSPKSAAKGETQLTPVTVTLTNPDQYGEERAVIDPTTATIDWYPTTDLDGVYDVELVVSNATITGFHVDVKRKSIATGMSTAYVHGLVLADFLMQETDLTPIIITSISESGNGYDIVATTTSTNTIDLVACSDISITSVKIESIGKTIITVS